MKYKRLLYLLINYSYHTQKLLHRTMGERLICQLQISGEPRDFKVAWRFLDQI